MPDLAIFGLPAEPTFDDIQRWEDDGGAVQPELAAKQRRLANRRARFASAGVEAVHRAALSEMMLFD